MTAGVNPIDQAEAAKANIPAIDFATKNSLEKSGVSQDVASDNEREPPGPNGEIYPTMEELQSLRHVLGEIPWTAYTIGFIELCERFSYYGTTAVFVNFISMPLPPGSTTGAAGPADNVVSGALDMGERASTGLTLFNSFWSYLMPIFGAYLADEYWGRYVTIQAAIGCAMVGHVILIIAALPPVIANPNGSLAAFIIGLIIFGVGVGGFKSNISPLIAEQYESKHPRSTVETLPSGERVVVDTTMTVSRIYLWYYFMINVGSLAGQIAMVYAEKYVGFWLSFTLPTIMFCFCPLVMFLCRNKYHRRKPTGSVMSKTFKLIGLAMKGRWSISPVKTYKNVNSDDFWESIKPSRLTTKPTWMTFDDAWVDEVARGLAACKVFCWMPIWWLAYSQMTNNLVSQAATMELGPIPNDVVNNLNPLFLVIFIPIFDSFIYPGIARMGLRFTPLKRMFAGFVCGTLSMVVAAVLQHYIYLKSPCGEYPNGCEKGTGYTPISVWAQTPAYILIAQSEIFTSITCLEYAFTKAPKNMRSLVTSTFLFTNAVSSAISQGFVGLSADPLLVWLYTTIAVIMGTFGIAFWFNVRSLDKKEDAFNMLPESDFKGRRTSIIDTESAQGVPGVAETKEG